MNAFIHASNQSTLWKVLNNVAQVQQYFLGAPPGTKEKWFQTHIGQIYQMYYGKQEALQSLNKKAIDIMLSSLQPIQMPSQSAHVPLQSAHVPSQSAHVPSPQQMPLQSAHVPLPQQMPLHQAQPHHIPLQTAHVPLHVPLPGQAIREKTMDEFSRRQAEYDAMVNKQTPVANFSEPIKDDAIIDLNSAVEQYKKAREPLFNDDQIKLQVEELPQVTIGGSRTFGPEIASREHSSLGREQSNEKKVQWSNTNQEHDHFETRMLKALANIEKDIAEIKDYIKSHNLGTQETEKKE